MNLKDFNQRSTKRDAEERRADRAAITIMLVAAVMVFIMFVVLELPR